jgi:hypothetical protein
MSANVLNLNSFILWPKSDFHEKKKISPIMNEGLANSFWQPKYALQAQINID